MVGLAYALVSISWGLGSTWALDTVGGTLETEGRAGNAALRVIVWVSVLLKLIAATLGLAVTRPHHQPQKLVVVTTWVAVGVLIVYGGVLTFVGLLVQADVIHAVRMPTTVRWPGTSTSGIRGSWSGDYFSPPPYGAAERSEHHHHPAYPAHPALRTVTQ